MELAHLTDIHLGPVPQPRFGQLISKRFFGYLSWQRKRHRLHRVELLETIRRDLARNPPDHIAVSGDLVNISLPSEFERALAWLERLGDAHDISVIPGNHDAYVGKTFIEGWKLWSAYMRSDGATTTEFPTFRRRGRLVLIGLSSAVPSPIGFAYGELGEAQLTRLETLLAAERDNDAIRVVQLHHPPLFSPKRRYLRDHRAFHKLIARFGAELIISGHEHCFHIGHLPGPDRPVPVVAGPSASLRRFDEEHAGGYVRYRLPQMRDGPIEIARYRFSQTDEELELARQGQLVVDNGRTYIRD